VIAHVARPGHLKNFIKGWAQIVGSALKEFAESDSAADAKEHNSLSTNENLWLKRESSHWKLNVSSKRREIGFMPPGPIPRS
jgi:hypothetical protein